MKPGLLALLLGLEVLAIAGGVIAFASQPQSRFLSDPGDAKWILEGSPMFLGVHRRTTSRSYRFRFHLDQELPASELVISATGAARVWLDGQVAGRLVESDHWDVSHRLQLPELLPRDIHELRVEVVSETGPAMVRASWESQGKSIGLHTDLTWEALGEDGTWKPAALADSPPPPPMVGEVETRSRVLPTLAGLLLACSAGVGLMRWRDSALAQRLTPGRLRWALIFLSGAVAANNLPRLPIKQGFDYQGHLDYIQFILRTHALPLPADGWQMFQSPLYYLLSALVALPLQGLEADLLVRVLRIIPIVCGLAQIELSYRTARETFPARPDLQSVATVVGGLLPMNFYLSQVLGNEPLHGALGALTLWLAIRMLVQKELPVRGRDALLLGASWGLALLTKATAILLAVPLIWVLTLRLMRARGRRGREFLNAALASIAAVAVSAWYYARNWLRVGSPFVPGWAPGRGAGLSWWQEPGYRTAGQFMHFGQALVRPFLAGYDSFWDGLYSTLWADGLLSGKINPLGVPPWNYGAMRITVWVSLALSLFIVAGILRALAQRSSAEVDVLGTMALLLTTYLGALLFIFVRVPIYSTMKATYLVALTPGFGVLTAGGFALLDRWPRSRPWLFSVLLLWSASVLTSYFALGLRAW